MTAKRLGVVWVSTLVILLGSFHPAATAETGERDYNFNIFLGERNVGADWSPYGTYDEVGLQSTWGKKDALVLFAFDVFWSEDKVTPDGGAGPSTHSKTWQFNPGFRKFWVIKKRFMPFLGIGGLYATADYEYLKKNAVLVDMDHSWGFWMDGGFVIRAGSTMNVGVSLRWEAVKPFMVDGENRSGNNWNLGLLLGWGSKVEAAK